MKIIENESKKTSTIFFDRSLYEWVARQELAEIVPQILKSANSKGAIADEAALSVLVYCYAIGVYRSDEIAARVSRNAPGSQWAGSEMDGKFFTQLRRNNGTRIKQCLAHALHHAFQVKWTKTRPNSHAHGNGSFNSDASASLISEAERRLEVADAWDLFDQEGVLGKSYRK